MRDHLRRRVLFRLIAWMVLGLALVISAVGVARGAGPTDFTWSAEIAGRPVDDLDPSRPLVLGDQDQLLIHVFLQNQGSSPLRVRSVRLSGQVIGMTFFSFTTRVDIEVPPGQSTDRRIVVDLDDLTKQATGLIPSQLSLLGPDRGVLDSTPFPVEVSGSIISVYGVFGFAVAGITAVLLVSLLLAIGGHNLPSNWWQRALRFLPVGLGVGLTLTFSLSAFDLVVPNASTWVTLVMALGAGAFLLGYFLPQGLRADESPRPAVKEHDQQDQLTADEDTPRALPGGSGPSSNAAG